VTARIACFAALGVLLGASGAVPAGDSKQMPVLNDTQVTYLERCGGCHGIQGHSAPGKVPSLRGQVRYFLCLPESRAYLVQLPSVSRSPLTDNEVADLMNFVVFDLGGDTGGRAEDARYTADEVHKLRERPLNEISLASYRGTLVERLIERCGAPASLREYSSVKAQ
jgi:mono/diheme cytochrome c family protein